MPIAMNGYSLESNWATRKLTVVVGGYGSGTDLGFSQCEHAQVAGLNSNDWQG